MSSRSNQKGSNYESKVAKIFSNRFSDYLGVDRGFFRQTHSGSIFGGKNRSKLQQVTKDNQDAGDIVCPMSFKFVIECKHYKTAPSFKTVFNGERYSLWDSWIKQVEGDAKACDKIPMLVFRHNGFKDELVMIPRYVQLNLKPFIVYKNYNGFKLLELLAVENSFFFKKKE